MTSPVVLGADCGGTSTRVVATTLDGRVVGRGSAGPGNPVARDPADTAAALVAAAADALDGIDPASVAGAVVGVAGVSRLSEPGAAAAYDRAWRRAGLRCPLRTTADAVVAFAAGSAAPSGSVLIAGTGAIACEIAEWAVVRRADGLGWLLGDDGSGFWFGRAAARLTAQSFQSASWQLTRPGSAGPLVKAVGEAVGGATAEAFVSRFYALSRGEVASLAPLVFEAARAGDPAASALVVEAAERLSDTLASLHPCDGPVVLAGSLLVAVPELQQAVSVRLRDRLRVEAALAGDAAEAAARLAAQPFLTS